MICEPGSPPELTESHSSERSSYTSQFSNEETFGGSMNFEEISLDAENHQHDVPGATQQWVSKSANQKDSRTTSRPALATLQTQQVQDRTSDQKRTGSSTTHYSKRTFTSPSVRSSPPRQAQRTRTDAYTLQKIKSTSGLKQLAQRTDSNTSIASIGRRGSWQPAPRKSVYEIEAEYHESDDELPDDASLFNVPISPFVSTSRLAPFSARSSPGISPDRSPVRSPAPIPLSHYKTTSDAPTRPRPGAKPSSRHFLKSRASASQLPQSRPSSTSPAQSLRSSRTKSWNLVLADLDHEARVIAEKLEFHQETTTRSRSPTSIHRSSAPGSIPLPPIQRGTLDFMPCSKEKEAVLSRTRPSWLPPKDPREEKKHLEEYKRIMKAALEAEKKREELSKPHILDNDNTRASLRRIWTYYVDPATDLSTIDKRVNDLCWRGLPPKLRGSIWTRKIGNKLGLTSSDYENALEKVREIKSRPVEKLDQFARLMQEWFADIERDAETAFPDLSLFQRHNVHWQDLINVCEVFVLLRANNGYVYGMQLVAAAILTQIADPAQALILMANCLDGTLPSSFQTGDLSATARACSKVKSTLNVKFPRLHSYLFDDENGGLGFSGDELLEPMFRTIFANGLDLDRLCRVFDIWIFEGDRFLVRTAVALLGALQTQILNVQGDTDLRRRNVQEMLGWGPYNRVHGVYWELGSLGSCDMFVEEIRAAGILDCTGR